MAMRPRTFGGANNSTGNRQRGAAVRPVYEDFKPKSEWIQNQESDNLLIYLPGFTKESVKVSTESGRNIIKVRGEHLVTGNKWQRFQEDFHAPDYCNLRGIRARFEGGILTITVPKNTISLPPKEVSKPIDKPTSQKIPEVLPAKPPQIPKDPLAQNVQEIIPPKITALQDEDKEKHVQESIVPPKPISPHPPKVHKKILSQKVQENMQPKITAPNNNDKAKAFQESPVADDKRKYDQTFLKKEKFPKKGDVEQKQKVDSGASKQQETMSETKAQHGHVEMGKTNRIPDLMDAEEAAKRRKIMEDENNAAKPESVEKHIQETERNKAHKTAFVDEDKAKYANKTAKITALKEEYKEKHVQESTVPPKPISPLPPKVPKEPLSQNVQENIPPKISAPNNNDKAKASQESPVSSNPISPISDDKRKYDQTFSKQEKFPKKSDVEQKQKIDSGASKQQETMSETKAQYGHVEMEKNERIPDLMDAEEATKRRKIMEEENNAAKQEFVEKNIQETERNKAHKTAFVDENKAKYPNKSVPSSGTGHFGVGNLKKVVKSLKELDEERKLLVNMGAAVIVFMVLGAYIYHTVKN